MKNLLIVFTLVLTLTTAAENQNPKAPVSPEVALLSPLYEQIPDISRCFSGRLTSKEIQAAFNAVNHIRTLHRLPPVTYKDSMDEASAKAALIVAANRSMTHHPAQESLCFSTKGARTSTHSNLSLSIYSIWDPTLAGRRVPDIVEQMKKYLIPTTDIIAGWLIDRNVPSLGHRRWLLNPFLTEVSVVSVIVDQTRLLLDASNTVVSTVAILYSVV